MGGLDFIHGGFLAAGLALAAVPVIVHLLFRRKAPRVDVGSLRFLRIAIRDNAHRRKIRRWLLLAIRTAGMLLLGLLFARPYRAEPALPGRVREVAVLIDRSASMGAGDPARSPIARARSAASKLIQDLPEGTEVRLALFDESGVVPVPIGELDQATKAPGNSGTDFLKAIAWARDRMVQSPRKLREVHIFTDLQRVGSKGSPPVEFPEGVRVIVNDVGRTLRGNLAIDDARVIRPDFRPGVPPSISARIWNAGSFPARDVTARLTLEGNGETIRLSEKVTIEGASRREVRFAPTIRGPGLYRGSVDFLDHDEMSFDDRRWLAFEARAAEGILLVDGQPGATVYANETYFLESALRLRLPGAGAPVTPYDPRRIAWEGGAGWPDLGSARVVVLANVGEVTIEVGSSLRRFVEEGGRLVIFAGSKVGPGALGTLRASGIMPAEVEGAIEGPVRFDAWEVDHPLFRPFSDPQRGDLRALTFLLVARLKPFPGSVVLASSRGDRPLVVESAIGKGRVLQLAIPADNEWGEWAIHRLYLPVIHQMMGYLTNRLPGSGPVKMAPVDALTAPGIAKAGDNLVVRNVDPAESGIDRMTLDEFRDAFRLPGRSEKAGGPEKEFIPLPGGSERPGEFWRPIAWCLLALLVAETFVANRTYG
jgi:Aerotolerance regulator N-terminal/von Willebrand factor type A domain